MKSRCQVRAAKCLAPILLSLTLTACAHHPTPCDSTSQFQAGHGKVVYTSPDGHTIECYDGAVFTKSGGQWHETTTGYFGN